MSDDQGERELPSRDELDQRTEAGIMDACLRVLWVIRLQPYAVAENVEEVRRNYFLAIAFALSEAATAASAAAGAIILPPGELEVVKVKEPPPVRPDLN